MKKLLQKIFPNYFVRQQIASHFANSVEPDPEILRRTLNIAPNFHSKENTGENPLRFHVFNLKVMVRLVPVALLILVIAVAVVYVEQGEDGLVTKNNENEISNQTTESRANSEGQSITVVSGDQRQITPFHPEVIAVFDELEKEAKTEEQRQIIAENKNGLVLQEEDNSLSTYPNYYDTTNY